MFNDKNERYFIIKMAELAAKYQEPYDKMDQEAYQHNQPLEQQYDLYRKILKDLCNF